MTVLYVASDQQGAGKTAVCATLASILEQRDKKVAVFKPLVGEPKSDPDADIYEKLMGQRADGWPLKLPKRGLNTGLLEKVKTAFDRVSEGTDVVLVEGSSDLSIKGSRQVADALDAKAVVVARYRDDLSASELKGWQEALGERLLGFVVNAMTRYMGTEVRTRLLPSMESEGLVSLGVVPEDRRLLGVSVRQLAEHLDGRFIVCEEKADGLVEHLMVGGMGMDPGEYYFGVRDNKAVIVRGDRPDLQMSALTTPTSCMVLTKGIEPIEYVKYESEQEEVSVMVVETDTLGTMEAVNTLVDRARFDHPLKLSRFAELLEQHVDLPALFSGLGLGGLTPSL